MIYRKFLLTLLLSIPIGLIGQEMDVFVSAHPDDWQLFMNPNAYESLKSDNRIVFLHTTAGDAGHGMGLNNYYAAREEGSLRAIRFMVNSLEPRPPKIHHLDSSRVNINGHNILRLNYGKAIIYFLRLPDGNYLGPGYPLHADKSLEKFVKEEIVELHTIDSSAIYKNKKDLKTSLIELLKRESKDEYKVRFHLAETDTIRNPADHSDHRYSSYLFQDLAQEFKNSELFLYEEYNTSNKPQNIFDDGYLVSAGTWAATASGLSDNGHSSTWDKGHNAWIGRQYFRKVLLDQD